MSDQHDHPEQLIYDPAYWRERLVEAKSQDRLYRSVFRVDADSWAAYETVHRKILRRQIAGDTSVLDVGCGYGRLLDLMPDWWQGQYRGVDISPDFVAEAQARHPGRDFECVDLRRVGRSSEAVFDLGVAVAVKHMIVNVSGRDEWDRIEANLLTWCRRLLILTYDLDDEGQVTP